MRLFLLLFGLPCLAAITGPVHQGTGSGAGSNSVNITITAATAGNCLILTATASHGSTVSAVSGGGVTWASVVTSDTNFRSAIWKGPNSSGSGTTITVTLTGSPNSFFNVSEWAGLDTSCTTDQSNSGNGNSATLTAPTITTTNANDLIIACGILPSSFTSGPTLSFTALNTPDNTRIESAYRIVSSTAAYFTEWSFGGATTFESETARFKAASATFVSNPTVIMVGP